MNVEINKGYEYPRLSVVRKPGEVPMIIKMSEPSAKKKKRRKKKEKSEIPFEDWCMPEQEGGYIRGANHEFF